MVSVGAGCGVYATEPDTVVATVNVIAATSDETVEVSDGVNAEHDVAGDAFFGTEETLVKSEAATVCLSDVAAVVDENQGLGCSVEIESCDVDDIESDASTSSACGILRSLSTSFISLSMSPLMSMLSPSSPYFLQPGLSCVSLLAGSFTNSDCVVEEVRDAVVVDEVSKIANDGPAKLPESVPSGGTRVMGFCKKCATIDADVDG